MSLRARVKSGRLVLDEPTALPEGTEVELVPLDEIEAMSDDERARLFGFLADSIREHTPGTGIDAAAVLAAIRSQR